MADIDWSGDLNCDMQFSWINQERLQQSGVSFEQAMVTIVAHYSKKHGFEIDEEAIMQAAKSEKIGIIFFTAGRIKFRIRFDSEETEKLSASAIAVKFNAPT